MSYGFTHVCANNSSVSKADCREQSTSRRGNHSNGDLRTTGRAPNARSWGSSNRRLCTEWLKYSKTETWGKGYDKPEDGPMDLYKFVSSVDYVSPTLPDLGMYCVILYILEENDAVIRMLIKARPPAVHHVPRKHRLNLDWLFELTQKD